MTITQDAGPMGGHQMVTAGAARAQVIVTGGTAFVQGNSKAVTSYLGFAASEATALANRWISIQPTEQPYPAVSLGVSLSSALGEVSLTGKLSETLQTTKAGQAVIGIQGTSASPDGVRSPATLYIATGSDLPVEFDTSPAANTSEQVNFSNWGNPVSVSAPTGAVAYSAIPVRS